MARADANLEGMSKKELCIQLELCRQKQSDLFAMQITEIQRELEAAIIRVNRRYKRRFDAFFMWDRRYCAALSAITGEDTSNGT